METPNDEAGRLTELIMFRATENMKKKRYPDAELTTGQYNSIYEAVYDTLSGIKL